MEWKLKRRTGKRVSTDGIDALYQKGIDAGAAGGKLLGAGGGGFMVFYAEKDKREYIKHVLKDLLYVPFEFENGGARIIHYSPEEYVSSGERRI